MQLDYDFLKKILNEIVNHESYSIRNKDLLDALNIESEVQIHDTLIKTVPYSTNLDKLIGHLLLLKDCNCIEFLDRNELGLELIDTNKSAVIYRESVYRLKKQGYDLLDILNNDTVFNKIKSFSISTVIEVGKALLIEQLKS